MKILLVDADKASRLTISRFLRDQEHQVTECENGKQALAAWKLDDYPLILYDIRLPDMSGSRLLNAISAYAGAWRTDVVTLAACSDSKPAIEALQAGAYGYLLKPVDFQELDAMTRRAAEHQALLRENRRLADMFKVRSAADTDTEQRKKERRRPAAELSTGQIGIFSESMRTAVELARRYHTDRSLPVLIQGETGTGKEHIAQIIHCGDGLKKPAGALVDINCAAIPGNLFESELFGYEGGAFTGGLTRGQKGKLDAAAGGTLFLDELAELPPEMQAKLLRVIEKKEYYRVGGLKKIKADVRIVCATNVDLNKRMEEGDFRQDLYYRLKVGHIVIPPLRQRRQDIVPLARMFIRKFAGEKGKSFTDLSPEAVSVLEAYDWPGNVRELKNVMEWIVFMYDEAEVKLRHLETIVRGDARAAGGDAAPCAGNNIILPLPPEGCSFKEYNDRIVQAVLAFHNGNQTAAAAYLGLSLRAFCYRLEQMRRRDSAKTI